MIEIKVNTTRHKGNIAVKGDIRIESDSERLPAEMATILYKMYNVNKEAFLEALDISLDWAKGDKDNG